MFDFLHDGGIYDELFCRKSIFLNSQDFVDENFPKFNPKSIESYDLP